MVLHTYMQIKFTDSHIDAHMEEWGRLARSVQLQLGSTSSLTTSKNVGQAMHTLVDQSSEDKVGEYGTTGPTTPDQTSWGLSWVSVYLVGERFGLWDTE